MAHLTHSPGVIVLGSVNADLVIRGPRLPQPGETVLGGEFFQAPGGKGANQAVAAARAGRPGSGEPGYGGRGTNQSVTFIGAVGDDGLGREAVVNLTREGIDTRFVKHLPGQPTGVALILVDHGGENLISVASGANLHLLPADVDSVPDEVFAGARVFLASLESPLATVRRGLERAKAAGLLTILNPAPASRDAASPDLLRLVDLLTPNRGEAALLAGLEITSDQDAPRAAAALRALGCGAVAVTLGPAGCVLVADGVEFIPGHRVVALDATAAGDAFNGALAAALAEGQPLSAAARWANRAAALSVTRRGAQPSLPTRAQIGAFTAP